MNILFRDLDRNLRLLDDVSSWFRQPRRFRGYPALPDGPCPTPGSTASWTRADIQDTEESLVLTVDLPGVRAEDVTVEATADVVTITGSRTGNAEAPGVQYKRTYRFPVEVDLDGADATVEHGVLTLTLPKLAPSGPRQIDVRDASVDTN